MRQREREEQIERKEKREKEIKEKENILNVSQNIKTHTQ